MASQRPHLPGYAFALVLYVALKPLLVRVGLPQGLPPLVLRLRFVELRGKR
jgi:hypothetical protein